MVARPRPVSGTGPLPQGHSTRPAPHTVVTLCCDPFQHGISSRHASTSQELAMLPPT